MTWKLQVMSYELWDATCEFLFTSCKAILWVANLFCELEIKLRVASCKFKETILRVASCALWVKNLK